MDKQLEAQLAKDLTDIGVNHSDVKITVSDTERADLHNLLGTYLLLGVVKVWAYYTTKGDVKQ